MLQLNVSFNCNVKELCINFAFKHVKCYPDVLQVQGNVPDERLNESLLQPEVFLSLIKSFILDLKVTERTVREVSWLLSGDLGCNQ